MDPEKQKRLEAAGWRFGDAAEFLGLSEEEKLEVDRRIALHDLHRGVYVAQKEGAPMVDNVLPIHQNLIPDGFARLNITYQGHNGDLPDPVMVDATDDQIRRMIVEALAAGNIPGIPRFPAANLTDFVVDRFAATAEIPVARVMVRPKTPFGAPSLWTKYAEGVTFMGFALLLGMLGAYVFDGKPKLVELTTMLAFLSAGYGLSKWP